MAAALAVATPAFAQTTDDAKTYFEIGAKAYGKGRFLDAATAFQEAYRLSQRPGLLFSLGQAYRMEFFARNDKARLTDAVRYYKKYLEREPQGNRAAECAEWLSKLEPMLGSAAASGEESPPAAAPLVKPRVMISSPTPGVRVTFDGHDVAHPFIAEVSPGKHRVVLSAPGYEDYSREIVVDAKSGAAPLDVPLKERPALLALDAPDGAEVVIDGRLQGVTPLPPLPLPSGRHFVAVTLNGHEPYGASIVLRRAEKSTLAVSLPATKQRTTSWVLMGVGAGGIVAGGVLGYVSLRKESSANDIRSASESQGNLDPSELARYRDLRQSRDDFRLAAVISAGAGFGVGAIGLVLNVFDQPKAPLPPSEEPVPGQPTPQPSASPSMEISAAPEWLPGFAGAQVRGRF